MFIPWQDQPRRAEVRQEVSSSMTRRWYLTCSATRLRKHLWKSSLLNTRQHWSGSPERGRSYFGISPWTGPCPGRTTAQTSRRCPAVTTDMPFAAATPQAEGGAVTKHSHIRPKETHTDASKQIWSKISPVRCAQLFVCWTHCLWGSTFRWSRCANKQRESKESQGSELLRSVCLFSISRLECLLSNWSLVGQNLKNDQN